MTDANSCYYSLSQQQKCRHFHAPQHDFSLAFSLTTMHTPKYFIQNPDLRNIKRHYNKGKERNHSSIGCKHESFSACHWIFSDLLAPVIDSQYYTLTCQGVRNNRSQLYYVVQHSQPFLFSPLHTFQSFLFTYLFVSFVTDSCSYKELLQPCNIKPSITTYEESGEEQQ